MRFLILISILGICTLNARAENDATFSEQGIEYTLQTDAYVYAPEDKVAIRYGIRNNEHLGILLPFADSRRMNFTIETPYGITGSQFEIAFLVTGQEYIPKGDVYISGLTLNLTKLLIVGNDNGQQQTLSAADGDTIKITGRSRASVFGIDQPDLEAQGRARWEQAKDTKQGDENYDQELDLDSNGIIDFSDFISLSSNRYILDWHDLPQVMPFELKILVRSKSADLDRDEQINLADFIYFIEIFGTDIGETDYCARGDFDGNGYIDFSDFVHFANAFQTK